MLVCREGEKLSKDSIRHERIHTRQMLEMLVIPFYLWYVVEWIVRKFAGRTGIAAYYRISFECEAYDNMYQSDYLSKRKPYAWVPYLFSKTGKRRNK